MPYGTILFVALIVLAIRYVSSDRVSHRSKWLVGGTALASIALTRWVPAWALVALALQLGISIYIILYLTATSEMPGLEEEPAKTPGGLD